MFHIQDTHGVYQVLSTVGHGLYDPDHFHTPDDLSECGESLLVRVTLTSKIKFRLIQVISVVSWSMGEYIFTRSSSNNPPCITSIFTQISLNKHFRAGSITGDRSHQNSHQKE